LAQPFFLLLKKSIYISINIYFFIIITMVLQSKLRSFLVNNIDEYDKFVQIQRNRGKKTGQRLNELIEREVLDADPNKKDNSPVRSIDMSNPELIPNPFVYTQPQANTIWLEFLASLSYDDWKKFEKLTYEIKEVTTDREYVENFQRVLKNL